MEQHRRFRRAGGVLLGYALRARVPFRVNPTYDCHCEVTRFLGHLAMTAIGSLRRFGSGGTFRGLPRCARNDPKESMTQGMGRGYIGGSTIR